MFHPPSNVQPSPRLPHLRFVIADDDHDLRFIIARVLAKLFPSALVAAFANGQGQIVEASRVRKDSHVRVRYVKEGSDMMVDKVIVMP